MRAFGGGPGNREQGGDDSSTTTTVRAFGGSPSTRVNSPDFLNLPVRVRASQEGRRESSGQYTIMRREGRAMTQSARPNAYGNGGRSRLVFILAGALFYGTVMLKKTRDLKYW